MALPTSSLSLTDLLQRRDIWRLPEHARASRLPRGMATGIAGLDAALHEGGWPRAALTELLCDRAGIGELQLLLPALVELSRQQLWQVWINPPFVPYAPVLERAGIDLANVWIVNTEPRQQLWACEQALRCAAVGAVLFWPSQPLRYAELRKLQVAAGSRQSPGFLFRAANAALQTSPAALRLQLSSVNDRLALQILKQRGGRGGQRIEVPRPSLLQSQSLLSTRMAVTRGADAEEIAREKTTAARRRPYVSLDQRKLVQQSIFARSERRATH